MVDIFCRFIVTLSVMGGVGFVSYVIFEIVKSYWWIIIENMVRLQNVCSNLFLDVKF